MVKTVLCDKVSRMLLGKKNKNQIFWFLDIQPISASFWLLFLSLRVQYSSIPNISQHQALYPDLWFVRKRALPECSFQVDNRELLNDRDNYFFARNQVQAVFGNNQLLNQVSHLKNQSLPRFDMEEYNLNTHLLVELLLF